jgi:hypothetical protein
LPAGALAAQSASLHVGLSPERLGRETNLTFEMRITAPDGNVPSPLTKLDVRYPSSLGLAISGLGLASCPLARLEALGPKGCPADSHMGQGTALTEIQIGPEIIQENVAVAILRAPEENGHLAMLFYATGTSPAFAEIAIPGVLVPTASPAYESVHIDVPLVPSLPAAPDVAVVQLHATFGPRGLTYYERLHGRVVSYKPKGILLPDACPHGGFRFFATLGFQDGSNATADTTVGCPMHARSTALA